MMKDEIVRLAEKYQKKAQKAFDNYQETGISRYDWERRKAEELVDALTIAVDAADDHASSVFFMGEISSLAKKADDAIKSEKTEDKDAALQEIVSLAAIFGLYCPQERKGGAEDENIC